MREAITMLKKIKISKINIMAVICPAILLLFINYLQ